LKFNIDIFFLFLFSSDKQQTEDKSDLDDLTQTLDESPKRKNIEDQNSTPFFLLSLLRLNSSEWSFIVIGSIASILLGMVTPGFALFLAEIYKLFTEPDLVKQTRLTRIFAIGIFISGLVGGICLFISNWAFAKSGEELVMRIRRQTFASLLRQEISYFDYESNSVGALMVRLSSDASALKVKYT
jgi:ABC-type multidrug transport system fused ATPase/permease subunit